MSGIALRQATSADAGELGVLFAASRRVLSFLPELHSVEDDCEHIRTHVLVDLRVTVASRDDRIAGFMAEGPGGWIEHCYVDARQLGTGIGSALIEDAKARHRRLELWCFFDNRRARRFYERHGFIVAEITDGNSNEAKMPDIRYLWTR